MTADTDPSNKTIPILLPTKIRFPWSWSSFEEGGHVKTHQSSAAFAPAIDSIEQAVECAKARRFAEFHPILT